MADSKARTELAVLGSGGSTIGIVGTLAHEFIGALARDPRLSDRLFRQFVAEVEQRFSGHADPIAAFFGVLLERGSPAATVFLDRRAARNAVSPRRKEVIGPR